MGAGSTGNRRIEADAVGSGHSEPVARRDSGETRGLYVLAIPEAKIEIKPDSRCSDLYHIWSGPHAKPGGMGAFNFLRDVGVHVNFDEAKR